MGAGQVVVTANLDIKAWNVVVVDLERVKRLVSAVKSG